MSAEIEQDAPSPPAAPRKGILAKIESSKPRRAPFTEYRNFIQGYYDGLAGKFTSFTGWVTGHETLAGRLIRPKAFDVRGCKRILDAGCGNGRYTKYLLRWLPEEAQVTAFDL